MPDDLVTRACALLEGEGYEETAAALWAECRRLQEENAKLTDWRVEVTAALCRPGGAFYADVATHIRDLVRALRGLHDDVIDYSRINNLGGESNRWLVEARRVLGLPENRNPE